MSEELIQVRVDDKRSVSAVRVTPDDPGMDWVVVYAPGAGSNIHDRFGRYLSQRLTSEGTVVVRFQFPYMEAKQRRPDPPGVLESTWRAVIQAARISDVNMVVAGRSMGGRIASQVVAQGAIAEALALFAYPLHPPGNPDRLRDGHLDKITVPTLFCSGTRDPFASPEELATAAAIVGGSRMHLLEDADHSFAPPKSSGRVQQNVWDEAIDAFLSWLGDIRRVGGQ